LIRFTKLLLRLRHEHSILRYARFLTGVMSEAIGVKDLTWVNATGVEMRPEDWSDGNVRCFGMMVDGRAQPTGIARRGTDATLLLIVNAHHDVVDFTLPDDAKTWTRLIDTNLPDTDPEHFPEGHVYRVTGRSTLLFSRT
jgi:glycogen operon protein